MPAATLNHHLSGCADCAAWLEQATVIGRALRVSGRTAPDLSAKVLHTLVLPAARIARYRRRLRVGLAFLGLAQWALSVPALMGQQMATSMGLHASHEDAAWNLALGAAFLTVALRPARAAGILPMLSTFVGVLTVLSLPDLADGSVGTARLASHAGVLLGLILLFLLERSERLLPVLGGMKAVLSSEEAPMPASQDRRSGRHRGVA